MIKPRHPAWRVAKLFPLRVALGLGGALAAVMAPVAAIGALSADETEYRSRGFILATVLYVAPMFLSALAGWYSASIAGGVGLRCSRHCSAYQA